MRIMRIMRVMRDLVIVLTDCFECQSWKHAQCFFIFRKQCSLRFHLCLKLHIELSLKSDDIFLRLSKVLCVYYYRSKCSASTAAIPIGISFNAYDADAAFATVATDTAYFYGSIWLSISTRYEKERQYSIKIVISKYKVNRDVRMCCKLLTYDYFVLFNCEVSNLLTIFVNALSLLIYPSMRHYKDLYFNIWSSW